MSEETEPTTDSTPVESPVKAKKEKREKDPEAPHYGLTRGTKLFITAIVLILVLLIGTIGASLVAGLIRARDENHKQEIATAEWSRRYVSLYDQYQSVAHKNPPSLSPAAVQYLINSQTSSATNAPIPGAGLSGTGGSVTPPSWSYSIHIATGRVIKITCHPAENFDPDHPNYLCK